MEKEEIEKLINKIIGCCIDVQTKDISQQMYNGVVKCANHVILNEVRMKNLSQLSTRFFPDESGLSQNDRFGLFFKTIRYNYQKVFNRVNKEFVPNFSDFKLDPRRVERTWR